MHNQSFLGAIAKAYADTCDDLSDYCFIFPNRRSGTFFLKNLSENATGHVLLAPQVLAVGDFMQTVAGMDVAPRITQLMELYLAYRELRELDSNLNDDLIDFDEFMPWGEVVLADFAEVDMYNVDAEKIFENVRDYRNIAADFLSDEQKEVIERFFGYRPDESDVRSFWLHFDREHESLAKNKYLELWQLLPELYNKLRNRLEHPNEGVPLSLSGSGFRIAMEKIKELGPQALPWKRIVVVGLDWLSTTEAELFGELLKYKDKNGRPIIEFFWDATGPILNSKDNHASRTVLRNRSAENFPEPQWARPYLTPTLRDSLPKLTEIAVPSNAMQTKVAGDIIAKMLKSGAKNDIQDARVAIVLPDESLLIPLLYSLPFRNNPELEEDSALDSVNLTMGLSLKYTSAASFLFHLRRIHQRLKNRGGEDAYLAGDIRLITAQPLVQVLVGMENIRSINTWLTQSKRRLVTIEEIAAQSEILAEMLTPAKKGVKLKESVARLENLLLQIDEKLSQSDDTPEVINNKVERMQLQVYLSALYQIEDTATRAGVEMKFNTLFHLLQRMTSGEKIRFEGEPLEGLQVMGFMETRALDFDRVIILSMNDKVMPKRARKRSFIPDSLRRGYGMPLAVHDENRYAYWFYRLLSRSKETEMIYDSRIGEGMRSGGKSRFLMQLEKIYARNELRRISTNFKLTSREVTVMPVHKTESIIQRLEEFKKDINVDGRNLSATALQSYLKCQILFLYRFVLQYNDRPENVENIDAIAQGDIFHDMMLRLYFKKDEQKKFLHRGKKLEKEWFTNILDDEENLQKLIRRSVNRKFVKTVSEHEELPDDPRLDKPLTNSSQMIADRLLEQVKGVLRYDRGRAPLTLLGGELKDNMRWKVNDKLEVNMTASFDRVEMNPDGGMRVVDYKTGNVHLFLKNQLDSVFNADYEAGNVFQLMLYAHLLEKKGIRNGMGKGPVEMVILETNAMQYGKGERRPHLKQKNGAPVLNHYDAVMSDFCDRLNSMIEEIFDPEIPFSPTDNIDNCQQCVMKNICGR